MICIFARGITDELASLVKQIDTVVEANEASKLAAFVVLLSADLDSSEQKLKTLAEQQGIKRVPLTVFVGTVGPPNYAIAEDARVTVMMWGGEKKLIRVNHTFGKKKLSQPFVARVVADAASSDEQDFAVSVGVFNTPITNDHLNHLATLTEVETLDLQDVNLSAAGLRRLRGLTRLRSLNLFRNKRLTDSAVDTLASFTQIEELDISSTRITNEGLARLAQKLNKLTKLNFRNSRQIDDTGLEQLVQRRQLQVLLCGNTFITDAGLAHISQLTSLRELEIRKTKIRNEGLAQLRTLTNLRNLNCSDNNITGDGLRHLSGLVELRSLDLSQTRLDDDGLAHLGGMVHLEELDLSRTPITGEGLRHLRPLKNLKFINLFATQATEASVVELQRALPNCKVLR